ncbi:MAG: hypothetical protein RL266_2722 [Bacteroidota bacterium]|jgi:hypothetical protein
MHFYRGIVLLTSIVLLTIAACKEPEGIGLDVLPDGEEMPIAWVDTFTIEAQTVRIDSVRTSGRGTHLIGDFADPVFGRVRSQLFTQFKLQTAPGQFTLDDVIDSIVLNLAYAGSYGRIDKLKGRHRFGIYEIQEDLYEDSIYYSDDTIQNVSSTPIAEFEFWPNLLSSLYVTQDSVPLPPSLRVRLADTLGQAILWSPNLASNNLFSEQFEGLCIRPIAPNMPTDHGSLLYFNLQSDNSRLELHYHNSQEDSIQYNLDIDNRNAIFMDVDHNFSQEIVDALNGGTTVGAEKLYIQSLAGTRIRMRFPHLKELRKLGAVAINKAEIVLTVRDDYQDDFGLPSILTVNSINEGDSAFLLIDSFEPDGLDYFGGVYDSEKKQYVFNVARHLQSIIDSPDEEDYGLYIMSLNAVDSRRGVFYGPEYPDMAKRLKLRMTYTIIN